jgi:hypothetical protein
MYSHTRIYVYAYIYCSMFSVVILKEYVASLFYVQANVNFAQQHIHVRAPFHSCNACMHIRTCAHTHSCAHLHTIYAPSTYKDWHEENVNICCESKNLRSITCIYVCIYIHTHTYIHIHAYILAYMHKHVVFYMHTLSMWNPD